MRLLNPILNRTETYFRYIMVHSFSRFFPHYIINEYPKSGGTWIGQMVSMAVDIPFPRNRFPVLQRAVLHGHYKNPAGMKNVLVVWRDGRDVMVSWYYHCLFENEHANARLVKKTTSQLNFADPNDIEKNLPKFIEYAFTKQSMPTFRCSWSEFVKIWSDRKGVVHVRYEDLRNDGVSQLIRIVKELTCMTLPYQRAERIVEEFSFIKQSGREQGEEKKGSFLRKGIIGDWKNCFSVEAKKIFNCYAGDYLVKLGYEDDKDWHLK